MNPARPLVLRSTRGAGWLSRLYWVGLGLAQALALAVGPGQGQGQVEGDGQFALASGTLQLISLALFWRWVFKRWMPGDLSVGGLMRATAWFMTAALVGTFWWLYISMHDYGGLPAVLAGLAVLLLCAAMSLFYVMTVGLWGWLQRGQTRLTVPALLGLVLSWCAAEWMRGTWFSGLPWGSMGYAHVDSALAAYAPWIGVYGMGLVAAALSVLLALGVGRLGRDFKRLWLWGLTLLLLVALPWGLGRFNTGWTQASEPQTVHLLQGNVPQNLKFNVAQKEAWQWYHAQLLAPETGLVVTPETASTVWPELLPAGDWPKLVARFAPLDSGRAALIGLPLRTAKGGYTNSALALSAESAGYRYDKHHLVPFGESIPPLFQWFVSLMNIPLASFERGALPQALFQWRGQRWAPNICYEDLFGEEMGRYFLHETHSPHVLVNLSNIAWFGNTVAIDQHLNISRMRALEFQRPMLRATNTGATAIIDHLGQVQAALPRHERAVLSGVVEGRSGLTPYARWVSQWGLWPFWVLYGLMLFWMGAKRWLRA